MENYEISKPDLSDFDELVDLNTNFFAKNEQTNKALNISSNLYVNYAKHITKKGIELEQFLIVRISSQIIGYVLWEDYDYPLYMGMEPNPEVFKIIAPELAFVEMLESDISIKNDFQKNKCARLLQIAILAEFQNSGIATKLAKTAIEEIKSKAFKHIIADCTANNSYKILKNLGFGIYNEIAYKDFIFEGVNPFSGLNGKRYLVLL